jgi:hypothetical protein
MTQFFDALERQLVALSMQTPRMTPRARARRRVAVGTVTVLCLAACVAGSSLLPRVVDDAPSAKGSLLAAMRTSVGPSSWSHSLAVALPGGGGTADLSHIAPPAASCGRSVPVGESSAIGRRGAVDANEGHRRELVCVGRSAAHRESDGGRPRCPGALSLPAQGATYRFIDDETQQRGILARGSVDPCEHAKPPLGGRQP